MNEGPAGCRALGETGALVVIGVNERGEKRLLAIEDGVRESTQSWREVLLKLKSRGMNAPELAIGDGAMGFWAALEEVYHCRQRCWMHKTRIELSAEVGAGQSEVGAACHLAGRDKGAEKAFDLFLKTYEPKYPKATLCLHQRPRGTGGVLDFPAQHWQSIRTSNPIESVCHHSSPDQAVMPVMLHMMFKLGQCAPGADADSISRKVITGVSKTESKYKRQSGRR